MHGETGNIALRYIIIITIIIIIYFHKCHFPISSADQHGRPEPEAGAAHLTGAAPHVGLVQFERPQRADPLLAGQQRADHGTAGHIAQHPQARHRVVDHAEDPGHRGAQQAGRAGEG